MCRVDVELSDHRLTGGLYIFVSESVVFFMRPALYRLSHKGVHRCQPGRFVGIGTLLAVPKNLWHYQRTGEVDFRTLANAVAVFGASKGCVRMRTARRSAPPAPRPLTLGRPGSRRGTRFHVSSSHDRRDEKTEPLRTVSPLPSTPSSSPPFTTSSSGPRAPPRFVRRDVPCVPSSCSP